MISQLQMRRNKGIVCPDSDGQPMAENTLQFTWIVAIKENLESVFAEREDVFVAGDLRWYPVEGEPKIRQAPDTLVAFGRPKGYRGSYKQWEEGGVAPQVVFEILSPGNRANAMTFKFKFYEHYGVEEYYVYDPDEHELSGWIREGNELRQIENMNGWVSPRLGIRFEMTETQLYIYGPDGRRFTTLTEAVARHQQAEQQIKRAEEETKRAEQERERAEQETKRAEEERQRAEREKEEVQLIAQQQAEELARLRERLKGLGEKLDG
jgi:Uma2 family endonuclease